MRGYDTETCKQSLRGAVLMQSTCGWDIPAATVVRRSQTTHCSHLRSRVSVGIESPKRNQHRQQGGERAEQTFGSNVPDPPRSGEVDPDLPSVFSPRTKTQKNGSKTQLIQSPIFIPNPCVVFTLCDYLIIKLSFPVLSNP